jgi:hypothetical protein
MAGLYASPLDKRSSFVPENCYLSRPFVCGVSLFQSGSEPVARPTKFLVNLVHSSMLAAIVPVAGCASIMSGRHAEVAFDSYPQHAQVVVRDSRGQEVGSVRTPGKVTLKRKERFIFPAGYTASIEAPGYRREEVAIRSTVNPWILGNVVIGGIPGLVIDNVTGAVWMPRDPLIYRHLAPIYETHDAPLQASQPAQPPPSRLGEPSGSQQAAVVPASAAPGTQPDVQQAVAGENVSREY